MKPRSKTFWIVLGVAIAAFNALFLSAMALAFFPKFNFNTIGQVICHENETILYWTEPGSAYTDPDGNVSYPEEIGISCVAKDGTQRKDLEGQAIFAVWGIYWLIFFIFSLIGAGIILLGIFRNYKSPT